MAIPCLPPSEATRRAPCAFYRSADDVLALSPFWQSIAHWTTELKISEQRSEVLKTDADRIVLKQQLAKAAAYADDWDTYRAPAPAVNTTASTDQLLSKAFSLKIIPASIVASAEGGVATYFFKGEKAAYIEYRNSGEAVAVMYDRDSDPLVCELDDSEEAAETALRAIGEYLA